MDKTTLICFTPFLVCFILFLKSIFKGSKLGRTTGMVLYLVFAIVFGLLLGYSFFVQSYADTMAINNRKSYMKIQFKRTLPPANIPKFLDKPTAGIVQGLDSSNGSREESKKEVTAAEKKGKIVGDTDSKIYHVPGSKYYEREMQKTSNNVYFNTVQEAETAGYRAPKR